MVKEYKEAIVTGRTLSCSISLIGFGRVDFFRMQSYGYPFHIHLLGLGQRLNKLLQKIVAK